MQIPDGSPALQRLFVACALGVAVLFVAGVHRTTGYGVRAAIGASVWMALAADIAAAGARRFHGRNYDNISGLTAIAVSIWLMRGHPSVRVVLAWKMLGVALLANIVIGALLSAPTPLRVFMTEPSSICVTRAPWVWLPAVMVLAALTGHLLVYRRLASPLRLCQDSPARPAERAQ
jgi:hypothetical protein